MAMLALSMGESEVVLEFPGDADGIEKALAIAIAKQPNSFAKVYLEQTHHGKADLLIYMAQPPLTPSLCLIPVCAWYIP